MKPVYGDSNPLCATCGKTLFNWCQCTDDEIRESLKPKTIVALQTCHCGESASITAPRTFPEGHSVSVCSPALVSGGSARED